MDTPVNGGQPASDPAAVIQGEITKPIGDSRKWKLINRGMAGVGAIFGLSAVLIFIKPTLAAHITALAEAALTAYGAIVAIGTGSIAAVDFRNSTSLSQIAQAQAAPTQTSTPAMVAKQ